MFNELDLYYPCLLQGPKPVVLDNQLSPQGTVTLVQLGRFDGFLGFI